MYKKYCSCYRTRIIKNAIYRVWLFFLILILIFRLPLPMPINIWINAFLYLYTYAHMYSNSLWTLRIRMLHNRIVLSNVTKYQQINIGIYAHMNMLILLLFVNINKKYTLRLIFMVGIYTFICLRTHLSFRLNHSFAFVLLMLNR